MPMGHRQAVSIGVQAGKFEYAGANSVRDADFETVTLGLRRFLAMPWRPQLDVSVNAGRERNELSDRQDLSRDLNGGRVGITWMPLAGWTWSASAVYQKSKYRAPDAVLLTTRDDRYVAGEMLLSWAISPSFSIRAE